MNWTRWLRPGLILTIVVAALAVFLRGGTIEADLGTRVGAALQADGQGWAAVEVSSRDVTILGRAPSVESQEAAVRVAERVNGVRRAVDGSELLPIASPYLWSAVRDNNTLRLSGSVPSEGTRAAVLAAARRAMPEAEIRDELDLARGAPAGFSTATSFALERLAALSQGTVTLTDSTLAVAGVAADYAAFAHAQDVFVDDLPTTVALGPVDVLPPRADPFVWSADYDGDTVSVVGFVPNDIVREMLAASIRSALPGVAVVDETVVASGEPAGFGEAATFAVNALRRLSRGGVTLDGLALDVSGDAKSVEDHESLLASLGGEFPRDMTVVAHAVMPAPVSPYGWRAERGPGLVVVSGYVPNAIMREEVMSTTRALFAGDTVEDAMRVAAGEPRMDWIGAIKFSLSQLALLKAGGVSLGDRTYAIEGEALSSETYATLTDTHEKTLPASLDLELAVITPPIASPYRFFASRSGKTVTVGGHVPDEAARRAILAVVQRKFGAAAITGDFAYAAGAPEDYVVAVAGAVQALSRVAGGRVEVSDTDVSIDGFAYHARAARGIEVALADALPEGFRASAVSVSTRQTGQPVAPEACGRLLQATLRTGQVGFDDDGSAISIDSFGLVDRIAATLARCPAVGVEVGAHTDSDGSASRNRERTQARAEAIVDYLVDAGIRRERLNAVGYGEDNPIADNGTDAGKAANRRIEFRLDLTEGG